MLKLLSVVTAFVLLFSLKGYTMTYEEITAEPKAVLRFTATWCPPCKALAPIFDEVAEEHPEMKTFVIDVDQYGDIAQKFGIKGIPTLMRIESGSVKMQKSGARPKPEVKEFFK
jgi:thioredoxin 1